MTSVGYRGAGLSYKSLINELVPFHFKTMIHALVREALQDSEEGVTVGGTLIKALRVADDQAMVAGRRTTCRE